MPVSLVSAGCYSIALLSYISVRVLREYKKPKAAEEAEEHAAKVDVEGVFATDLDGYAG